MDLKISIHRILFFLILISRLEAKSAVKITGFKLSSGVFGDVLECCCTENPLYNVIPDRLPTLSSFSKVVFFLPSVGFEKKATLPPELLKKDETRGYEVVFRAVKKPIIGVEISITYNPAKIILETKSFQVLSSQKGVLFFFYDKQRLAEVSAKTNPILHYAWSL